MQQTIADALAGLVAVWLAIDVARWLGRRRRARRRRRHPRAWDERARRELRRLAAEE